MHTLKLNYKRTFFIGLAFFTILMLWQVYNSYVPLMLEDLFTAKFGSGNYKYLIGLVMAFDNVLALIMLPIFGSLSDRTDTKLGKRMPYIIGGTILAIILFPFIPFFYTKGSLIGIFIAMGLILISMNIYRSPAVALMPDITPKPLRSKANGVINFVGFLGAIFAGVLALIYKMPQNYSDPTNIAMPFIITSIFMVFALVLLYIKIKENKISAQMLKEMELGEELAQTNEKIEVNKPLSKVDKTNLKLIIVSVFFWFLAFNAIETFWSTYGEEFLLTQSWSLATIILTVASLVTFIPAGILSEKIGRKRSIIIGLMLMLISLSFALFIRYFNVYLILCFAISGAGWAMVNVNAYPMVVELANKKNVGKYTGYYYTSSMVAQSVTPVFMGALMDVIGFEYFFVYSIFFAFVGLVIFTFIKEAKNKKN